MTEADILEGGVLGQMRLRSWRRRVEQNESGRDDDGGSKERNTTPGQAEKTRRRQVVLKTTDHSVHRDLRHSHSANSRATEYGPCGQSATFSEP